MKYKANTSINEKQISTPISITHRRNLSPIEIENGITNLKKELHAGVREQNQKKL